jgi:hypothetical protein
LVCKILNESTKIHFTPFASKSCGNSILEEKPKPRYVEGHSVWRRTITLTLGSAYYALYVLEMLIGLILTSLAVTGFTGLLKGDDDPR